MTEELKRLNMKELRDTLNKLPEDWLEITSIAPDTCTDFPDGELALVTLFQDDDEKWSEEKVMDFEPEEKTLIIERLIDFINKDLKAMKLSPDEEGYDEEYGSEPDW